MPIDDESLRVACARLGAADADMGRVLERWGPPPLWSREPGFGTLIHLILEQQVSLASARAAMDRLVEAIGPPTPRALLALDDHRMLSIGFSRQKRDYARVLANAVQSAALDLAELGNLADADVSGRLTAVKGIGRWTADIYLLMALGRPDVWPVGDRALVVAARALKGLEADPGPGDMAELAEPWRPWRSVAARVLWHLYLSEIRPPRTVAAPRSS